MAQFMPMTTQIGQLWSSGTTAQNSGSGFVAINQVSGTCSSVQEARTKFCPALVLILCASQPTNDRWNAHPVGFLELVFSENPTGSFFAIIIIYPHFSLPLSMWEKVICIWIYLLSLSV